MRLLWVGIILGLIAVIPFGVWVSIGLFSIWLYSKYQNVDLEHTEKYQFDPKILDEMR